MTYKLLRNGLLSYTFEPEDPSTKPTWRIQIYWPTYSFRDTKGLNIHLSLDFAFRLAWGKYKGDWQGSYRSFGFRFFGFGFGLDRSAYKKRV